MISLLFRSPNRINCLFIIFLASISLTAQTKNEVLIDCPPIAPFYNEKVMYRTYKFHPHQKVRLIQILYGERGYHIGLCKTDSRIKYNIQVVNPEDNYVYWDNSNDNYSENVHISFGSTHRVFIVISVINPEIITGINNMIGIEVWYHKDIILNDTLTLPPVPPNPFK